ncbi:hypothetical protein TSUD_55030 [Trifolium subterraneum]|uniref:F-box domain-containing protein n=1 Tax=Trifolium subterraneum TaxID=3900 RepID=A0A2Z6MTW7_TRISU|nr:hypothetical protein TSUD_55030 [Trifolium subterraneum]
MSEEKHKKVRVMEVDIDLISSLPDDVLTSIISLLPGMEIVRTSVLSKRWETVWKYSSHLNFDQRQMLRSRIEVYIQNFEPSDRLDIAMRRKIAPEEVELYDPIAQAAFLIESIMNNHIGPLKSCKILHMSESCASGDVVRWMRMLLKKEVIKVSLERESCDYQEEIISETLMDAALTLDLPFEVFSNFEVLKLKSYHFKTTANSNPQQALKTFTLNTVRIMSNNFQDILSCCLCLENLTLENCIFFGNEVNIDWSRFSSKWTKAFDNKGYD